MIGEKISENLVLVLTRGNKFNEKERKRLIKQYHKDAKSILKQRGI
jgi:hypothetical protein